MITLRINGTQIGGRTIATRTFDESEIDFNSAVLGADNIYYDNAVIVIPVGNSEADEQFFDDYANQLGPQEVTMTFDEE